MELFNRVYELQIGDAESGDGLLITDLKVDFQIKKSANNKENPEKASITITNLSAPSRSALEQEYPVAIFSCGYEGDVVQLFRGEVTDVQTKKQGADRVTKLRVLPFYSELTHKLISEVVPENSNVEDVIEVIRKNISNLAKGSYKGENLKLKTVYGYPLTGTPRQMLDQVCDVYNLEWRIENESLYINGYNTTFNSQQESAPVISPSTGLIDAPYAYRGSEGKSSDDEENTKAIRVKALINPSVVPGSIVKIEYEDSEDFYKVEEVEFSGSNRGSSWYMDCICVKTREQE